MTSVLSVEAAAREFVREIDLTQREFNKAAVMALNRTADGARVDASREIRARYQLKVATVNKAFSINKAGGDLLTVVLNVRGKPLNLGNFDPRQTAQGRLGEYQGSAKAHPARLHRAQRWVSRGDDPRDPKGRVRTKRLPIRPLTTVDIPGLFVLKTIREIVTAKARDRFNAEFASAVNAVLARR
jgi:hypothetical protein